MNTIPQWVTNTLDLWCSSFSGYTVRKVWLTETEAHVVISVNHVADSIRTYCATIARPVDAYVISYVVW